MRTGAPFDHVHIKPFPIRAAFDIGTAGCVSLAVGRVDAQHRAIQAMMHHQQCPITMSYAPGYAPPTTTEVGTTFARGGSISNATMTDIRAKFHLLSGVLKRQELLGVTEVAGLLSYPLCVCNNAVSFAEQLTREFRVDVRVLGSSFPHPPGARHPAVVGGGPSMSGGMGVRMSDTVVNNKIVDPTRTTTTNSTDPRRLLDALAFESAAAAAQCVARHRMLCIEEPERHGVVVLSGWDHHRQGLPVGGDAVSGDRTQTERVLQMEEADFLNLQQPPPTGGDSGGQAAPVIVRHALPLTVDDAQRMLLVNFQRRHIPPERMTLAHTTSPNPVLRLEWTSLVAVCEKMIAATLPSWVVEKSQSGGIICGASMNGGLLNVAVRVSQQQNVSLDHLETNAEHHFCGLTDVLMDAFPEPERVMASAALSAGLMRALATPRIRYLPDVCVAHGLLVAEGLWAHDRAATIRSTLGRKKWYQTARMRSFEPPRNKTFRGQPSSS